MSEQDLVNSKVFNKLHLKGNIAITFEVSSQVELDRIYNELCQLLGRTLHQHYFVMINKIWWNAQQWLGIVDKINVANDRVQWLNGMLSSIGRLKKDIKSWRTHSDTLSVFAFIQGGEPDFESLLQQLDSFEEIVLYCRNNMQFKRGGKYSKDKIQRHAVFGLFCIGEAIGLLHDKRPSKLYRFVHIVTGIDNKEIGTYYRKSQQSPHFCSQKKSVQNPCCCSKLSKFCIRLSCSS